MERYGYIRVSAKDQNPERQFLSRLLETGFMLSGMWILCNKGYCEQ